MLRKTQKKANNMQIKYKNKILFILFYLFFFLQKMYTKRKNEMAPHRPNQQTAKNN